MKILTTYFPELTAKQVRQFAALKDLYTEWNQKINVISRKDIDNFYEHHVLHSLTIVTWFDFPGGYEIMDLGSGGGFPGIPLAIYFPEVKFYLIDSINKKLKVAAEIASAIGLSNIVTQHTRAEEIRTQQFDVVVSRAVAPLKNIWAWSKPLIKKSNGKNKDFKGLICLKGGDLNNEVSECDCRPQVYTIDTIYKEAYFKEKFVLSVEV